MLLLLHFHSALAQDKPSIPDSDRTRLAEAFNLGDNIGEVVWRDWNKAPFALLLVTPEYEFLIRHPKPSADFMPLGYDALLKSDVYFRKRTQPTNFLATFPAIGGSMISTIVVGQAENERRLPAFWRLVVRLQEVIGKVRHAAKRAPAARAAGTGSSWPAGSA